MSSASEAGSAPAWRRACILLYVSLVRRVSSGRRAAGRLHLISFSLLLMLLGSACTSVPAGRSAVDTVDITGNDAIDADDLREKLATTPSPKFFGVFRGVVYDYSVFDRFVLDRDLQRIERFYRARGYYQARARAARVFFVESNKVRVDIRIEEGEKMRVARVDVHGLEALKEPWVDEIQKRVTRQLCGKDLCMDGPSNRAFDEDRFQNAAELLQRELANHGYAYSTVKRAADVDLPNNRVSVGYFAKTGPKAVFGAVTIVGLRKVPEEPVRRAVDIVQGTPYSREELDLAERALLDLNVFSSVVITPELDPKDATQAQPVVPIKVTVEPSMLKGIRLGGGLQVNSIQSDFHLVGGWEHRNFFGGLRSVSFEVKPGLVLYPTRFPTFNAPTNYLPEARFNASFRQPGFLEPRTGAFTRLDGTISPVILSPDDTSGNVLGYRDIRVTAGLDRSFNSLRLFASLSPTVQFDSPFAYLGDKNKYLTSVIIAYPELVATLDLRDNQVHPHAGAYLTSGLQIALPPGSATDVKTTTEARVYVPVPGLRKWTLATRVRVGLLFPQNYGGTIEQTANNPPPAPCPVDANNNPTDAACEQAQKDSVKDTQLMFLRGEFAGGLGSNRGYAQREIGPHGVVQQGSSTLATCASGSSSTQSCDLPLGGFTLWEASLELRYPISGALSGAIFTDTADVSAQQMNFRLNRPHLSVGLGVRYDTPVGPIRLDAGYRVPGLQAPTGAADEGVPSKTFGLPLALTFGIGEAF